LPRNGAIPTQLRIPKFRWDSFRNPKFSWQIIAGFSCGSVAAARIRRIEVVPPPILPPQVLSSGDIAAVVTNPSSGCAAQEIA